MKDGRLIFLKPASEAIRIRVGRKVYILRHGPIFAGQVNNELLPLGEAEMEC